MALTRTQKEELVARLKDASKEAKSISFITYQGTNVADLEDLRTKVYEAQGKLMVAKANLVKLALKENDIDLDDKLPKVPVAMIVALEDEVMPVKAIAAAAKKLETVNFVGGFVEGEYLDEEGMKALSKIPSKDELIAKVVGSIAAPLSGLVGVLSGTMRGFVSVLHQRSQQSN